MSALLNYYRVDLKQNFYNSGRGDEKSQLGKIFMFKNMIVTKIKGLKVNYYKVEQVENNLNELKCFEYYRDEGYNVYIDYLFYFKYGRLKEEENIIKVPKHKTDNKVRIELVRKNPKFKKEIFKLFKKYDDGFPDLLIEKDNRWKFVEVKPLMIL